MNSNTTEKYLWWQNGIIYQIYPRSFKDSNGDGIGDLNGIIEKLDYLKWLGVTAIWISPIFPSPMADFGYDISDYTDIHPMFGSLKDFNRLQEQVHEKGLKVILDLVPNHTSDQHPWFLESKSSKDNPKRDWYIWKDPQPDGSRPNNWKSNFGGPGWTFDEATGQYYYHAFLKEQPDLNWRNTEVRKAVFDAMRFWLDRGVDGFRVDVIWHMIKDQNFRNNPPNPDFQEGMDEYDQLIAAYSTDQPEVHEVISEMRKVVEEYEDRLLIGEIYLPIHRLVTYYGENGSGVHLPFNFQLVRAPWDPAHLNAIINEYEGHLPPGGWPNWVLSNHDNIRIASRIGREKAVLAAVLLLTLRGTPTLYYGDELGMEDVEIHQEKVQDPQGINMPGRSRDPQRTPMQWNSGVNAGFSDSEPWLPLMKNHRECNVEEERKDPESFLNLYHRLIQLRQQEPTLQIGDYIPVGLEGDLMTYKRKFKEDEFLVLINWGKEEKHYRPEKSSTISFSTDYTSEEKQVEESLVVPPFGAIVLKF